MAEKKMRRGVQQALYKYLPGSWVDYTQSGGGVTYAVHVDYWNSIQLAGINNKRLLRVVNQRVHEFIEHSSEGEAAVVDFAPTIDEESYEVLTPKVSDTIAAIHTSVKPWVFACSSCGRVRQYYSYDEFKRREHQPCDKCGKHMTQIKMIRFCRCGYADGIYVPKCQNPEHGTKYMYRRGSGTDFVCSKCGKKAVMSHTCPDCHNPLEIRPALDSSHFIPATVTLIDLLDKRKDVFLDNETDYQGEKVVVSHYLGLVSPEQYEAIVAKGSLTREDDFEKSLQAEADSYRALGIDESAIAAVIDAKRRGNPNTRIFEAIGKVSNGLSISIPEEYTPIAEAILEYNELFHAKVTLSLEEAADDAELINDGIKPNYRELARRFGFSNVQLCSSVPIVFCSYGYTRKEQFGDRIKLRGFPREMERRNIYAARLETEGVLFEIDRKRIIDWLLENRFISDLDKPKSESEYDLKLWFLDRIQAGLITPFTEIDNTSDKGRITKAVYTLIHSISHALIREAAEVCGLDKSSLSEYILPNIPAIFIYCANSQGFSMGALYSAFQSQFDKWLKHAKENSKKCIFDPICINHDKACAGCLFLNEVSCKHFNKDLDRSYLCGYFDVQEQERLKGFWE
ncbi:DUF1998 domain-containing protein [Gemmiger sp. An120]|uniref:DUF1998 domain-containing protein n=1 Tax=Gemmiger sp. An120 TaxID=1965549 RepID=UPI00117AB939|nr:DUF1998 domain-containing protein [Gemmiger sp. An120]